MSRLPFSLHLAVGDFLGVVVHAAEQVGGGDINEAWRLDTSSGPVFVKAHATAGVAAFEAEAAGLAWLAEPGALRLPRVLAVAELGDGPASFLALEWIESGPPAVDHDEALGRGLAEVHQAGAPCFGLDRQGSLGSLRLDNAPTATWAEFFWSRRLDPLVDLAVEAGGIDPEARRLVDRLHPRLADLAGPPEPPARLHGDLWAGNAMVGPDGEPVLIDPAAHGGHREVDLAMMALFGGFDRRVVAAYDERWPLADGWQERLALWQLQPLLVHAVLFGGGYGAAALRTLRRFA